MAALRNSRPAEGHRPLPNSTREFRSCSKAVPSDALAGQDRGDGCRAATHRTRSRSPSRIWSNTPREARWRHSINYIGQHHQADAFDKSCSTSGCNADGKLYGLPIAVSCAGSGYNELALERLKLPQPPAAWGLAEYAESLRGHPQGQPRNLWLARPRRPSGSGPDVDGR